MNETDQNPENHASCIFCTIVAGTSPASRFYTDSLITAFMDIRPVRLGQVLIIPNEHIDHFTDLDDRTALHIMTVAMKIGRQIRVTFQPERVGMVVHGYGVPHAHLILVPQHDRDDITSARFAEIEEGKIRFRQSRLPETDRATLDRTANFLRLINGRPAIASLFARTPFQWGLRGDPHLWNLMIARFGETPLPEAREELRSMIEQAFHDITGVGIETPEPFYREELNHGGMSGGMISPEFWREKGVPFLLKRFDEMLLV